MWSAENPYLYTLVLTLKYNGTPIEYISSKFGFRKVEIKNGIIHFNGKRIVFKGTNRHEFDCRTGRYITEEVMAVTIALKSVILSSSAYWLSRATILPSASRIFKSIFFR